MLEDRNVVNNNAGQCPALHDEEDYVRPNGLDLYKS